MRTLADGQRRVANKPAEGPDAAGAHGQIAHSALLPPVVLLLIGLAAGALRFWNLASWPVFLDEESYTSLALESLEGPWWEPFMGPTVAGKPPFLFLLQGSLIQAGSEPVVAGRLLSALSGVVSTGLCFFLGWRLAGPGVGLVAAALYAFSPIAVLHERMVLQDGPMTAFALAAALVGWSAIERASTPLGGAAALLGAAAVGSKIPGVGVTVLAIRIGFGLYGGVAGGRLLQIFLAAVGPVVAYLALMFSPVGPGLLAQDLALLDPLGAVLENLDSLVDTTLTYLPGGLAFLVLLGAGLALWRKPQLASVFLVAILVWTVPWLLLSNAAWSRYYLPAVPYACALAALALVELPARARALGRAPVGLLIAAGLLCVAWSGAGSLQLVLAHPTAPMTRLDHWQYRSGWPSGYAYAEAGAFVAAVAERDSSVAYLTDPAHRLAVGSHLPLPTGANSLGLVTMDDLMPPGSGVLYVVADDAGRSAALLQSTSGPFRDAQPTQLARFTRPGSQDFGVSVYRLLF